MDSLSMKHVWNFHTMWGCVLPREITAVQLVLLIDVQHLLNNKRCQWLQCVVLILICRRLWSHNHKASSSATSTHDDCMWSVRPDEELWELESYCSKLPTISHSGHKLDQKHLHQSEDDASFTFSKLITPCRFCIICSNISQKLFWWSFCY